MSIYTRNPYYAARAVQHIRGVLTADRRGEAAGAFAFFKEHGGIRFVIQAGDGTPLPDDVASRLTTEIEQPPPPALGNGRYNLVGGPLSRALRWLPDGNAAVIPGAMSPRNTDTAAACASRPCPAESPPRADPARIQVADVSLATPPYNRNRPVCGRFRYWLHEAQAARYRLRFLAPAFSPRYEQARPRRALSRDTGGVWHYVPDHNVEALHGES